MMKRVLFLILVAFAMPFYGCQNKLITDNVGVNKWVHETMKSMYLWSSSIGNYVPSDMYPAQYFELLRFPHDMFSRIESNGSSSGGWSTLGASTDRKNDFGFAYILNSNKGVINYVVPKSPADFAGLKRGDVFDAIISGGVTHEVGKGSGIWECFSDNKITLCLINPERKNVEVSKSVYYDTPVIFHKVIETSAGKTGYLVYNHFTSGENGRFLDELKSVISDFNASGVRNLVLDLRYNGGGELTAAILLSSMLAHSSDLGQPYLYLERNIHAGKNYRDYEMHRFLTHANLGSSHLELDKLCIISLKYTASASELVLHGLTPFFRDNLLHIGKTTYGKNIGTTRVSNARYLWSINISTMRVYDINGESGYENGICPAAGNEIDEEIISRDGSYFTLGDFGVTTGDNREKMLAAAIHMIEHGSMPSDAQANSPSRFGSSAESVFPGAEQRGLVEREITTY